MKFRVWSTVADAFDYCWRERRAMLRFGWIPVLVVVAVSSGLLAVILNDPLPAGSTDLREKSVPLIVGLIQAVVYLPTSVTWYQKVVLGDAAAEQRPMFTLGRLEMRMLGWQIAVMAGLVAMGVVGGIVIIGLHTLLAHSGETLSIAVTAILTLALLLVLGFVAMRLAIVLVLVALDKPVHVREAWRMTAGVGWRLCGAVALTTLGGAVLGVVGHLVALVVGMIVATMAGTTADNVSSYLNAVITSLIGYLIFLASATVFGFVYRMLAERAATVASASDLAVAD